MGFKQVRVEATVIGVAKVNTLLSVPDYTKAEEAEVLGNDYLRIQYPKPYARGTILEVKTTFIDNTPKPEPEPAPAPKVEKANKLKPEMPRNRLFDSPTTSRKKVKEELSKVTA
jgi:hypothetical protein